MPGMRPLPRSATKARQPASLLAPAGVAWWGEACTYGGPYEPDAATLLLLHLDGNTHGALGEPGTAHRASDFAEGVTARECWWMPRHPHLRRPPGTSSPARGPSNSGCAPTWNGNDGGNHTLFRWGDGDEFLHLRKDGISNLVFDLFYAGGSCGAPHGVADWQAGEWHHLAFTWQGSDNPGGSTIRLVEDGIEVARTECGGIPGRRRASSTSARAWAANWPVDAVIDELRISAKQRLGNSLTCGRTLVADSGNHRVLAFDHQGNLVAAFGSFGDGPGRFDTPQGLVVDSSGRIIVADQGNNRLVVLGFDGQTFDYLRILSGRLQRADRRGGR